MNPFFGHDGRAGGIAADAVDQPPQVFPVVDFNDLYRLDGDSSP
ncbi:hypothetical protein [Heliomicrobium undosum]|nr:hypothetical protein [Heliomicrobium undosum]